MSEFKPPKIEKGLNALFDVNKLGRETSGCHLFLKNPKILWGHFCLQNWSSLQRASKVHFFFYSSFRMKKRRCSLVQQPHEDYMLIMRGKQPVIKVKSCPKIVIYLQYYEWSSKFGRGCEAAPATLAVADAGGGGLEFQSLNLSKYSLAPYCM